MLQDFLLNLSRSDHVWSQSDCAMTVANWWMCKHGFDPAADLRGTYHTEKDCQAVIAREGGLLNVVTSRAVRAGALVTDNPRAGDIGVIRVHDLEFGAILTSSGRWAAKSVKGLAAYRCAPIAAWKT